MFHDFLARRAEAAGPDGWRDLHRRAADVYRERGENEEAVYHLLQAGESAAAAVLLCEIGGTMIAAGRWETLADWLDRLPGPNSNVIPTCSSGGGKRIASAASLRRRWPATGKRADTRRSCGSQPRKSRRSRAR